MVKEVFLLCFIIHSRFFVLSCLSCKQFLKNTCQPYKIWYRKAYATATGFRSLQKKVMTHLLKGIFLHHEKDQTKNFSPFSYERPFDHWKEFLKSSQFHFKGFHFKSTSIISSFNKGMVEKQKSHWNKKSFRDVFRIQSKNWQRFFMLTFNGF